MPMLLKGSCHCRAIKFTLESNTPVPYQMCQCSICRKVGGYMGSVNIMGNTASLEFIRGKDKIKEYQVVKTFDKDDKPKTRYTAKRSFCSECSTMLWNAHPEWPEWIYPFASCIDTDLPAPADGAPYVIMRDSCPDYIPVPAGWEVHDAYGPAASTGIAEWHKENGAWVE